MTRYETETHITITVASRRSGLSPRTVRRYIKRGLVNRELTEAALLDLRRNNAKACNAKPADG
ncbi:MAG: MerR family DNA-binding transcriptional regulator [Anaerolineae bacterium]|nr:MerR family DNA-binding transcriptional regulator [Anaerolineae bacterium]